MESSGDGGDERAAAPVAGAGSPGPASAPPAAVAGGGSGTGASGSGGKPPVKRMMKTPYQLEVLERTYSEDPYPNEGKRAELSVQLGLTDRQLQMWFCHRRLKDRKPQQTKRQQMRDEEGSMPAIVPPPPVLPQAPLLPNEITVGTVGGYGEHLLPGPRRGPGRSSAVPRITVPEIGRGYYAAPQIMLPHLAPMQLTEAEQQVIDSIEALIGEPLRDDGPVLGIEFDPLPPGAFGAPIVPEQQKQPYRHYESKMFPGHDHKLLKASAFLPSVDHFVPNHVSGKRKSLAGSSSHLGSLAVQEYQFLPEQPSDIYERASQPHFYDVPAEASNSRISSLNRGSRFLHGTDQAPNYTFHGQTGSSHLAQHGRSPGLPLASTDHDMDMSNINLTPSHGQLGMPQIAELENSLAPSDMGYHDEDTYRVERKRKHIEEAKIAKEVEAHEKRIRKELEKQDLLNRKREEQMRREMERQDRERRKEEDRLLRERQRENERLQREQRRENKRMEKFLQKQSIRAEKLRQKEELRKEKEAARQKAANERATARRIAREYTELMEDERLELMELAARSKGLPSMLSLDSDTLQQLDSFRGMLRQFPTESVILKVPFSVKPWTTSEDNIGNLLMVWKFFITFADVLRLPSFTLDEFIQALHDYDSRLLGELHVGLLKVIIKDIEDVARTPSVALGVNQSSANPGGGHPQIVEGAYAWGFNILTWQQHLNFISWPEILRQFGLCAGFGPPLKKRSTEIVQYRDDNEGHDGENVISTLRSGSAAVNAAAKMKERGYTNRRRSRHRLTPGTVKFAAFHVLSLEGSKGLTILEVAEKIQKSGLRDLTTSKTPEASISAALSRDTKLFERTAPSTYCVKEPYRKDPADSEAVLSVAREKIRAFQNDISECEEVEKDVDDADRDEDSDGDEADDDPDGDEVNIEDTKSPSIAVQDSASIAIDSSINKESIGTVNTLGPATIQAKPNETSSFHTLEAVTSNSADPSIGDDTQDTEIDESNQGESWVQGLAEGDYCDLSVEERLNALVALIGVATEGNSIRGVLEERLEAAIALKKQMWAEAQLDKRRLREEFTSKMQYDSSIVIKADAEQENNTIESNLTPLRNLAKDNGGSASTVNNDLLADKQNQLIPCNIAHEQNGVIRDLSATPENLSIQQYASSEKTRSQLKSYINHKAEQLYVYRSLPLGQDRRRNRYWQFCASASPNDRGSGRIFFESRDGYWRVIDSTEAFDALVASLDTRGIRESHLYSMLQSIEPSFKEAVGRKKCSGVEHPPERVLKNGSNEIVSPNCSNEFGSVASDNTIAYSDTLKIELGRNDAERIAISKRAHVFIKWMWKDCYNHQSTCAMKYGKKRLPELIQSCDYCYQIHLAEERHCSSCHRTFKPIHNFLEHLSQCEEKQKTDPNWKIQTADNSIPLGLRLLKLLLASIEAFLPAESLQSFWTDGYRKSWGVKLYSASSAEEVFQMLTMLEGAIKRDYLSADFETTTEWLFSSSQDIANENSAAHSASAAVLPWVPDTTAAVALRLLELDSAIAYTNTPKAGSNKEQGSRDFTKLPARSTAAKNKQAMEQFGTAGFGQQDRVMLTHNSGRRGRGRGSRGGSRGGRSRSRGGRVPRSIKSSSRIQFTDDNTASYEEMPRKYARRGRASSGRGRGRGRGRGLRTVRPRQPPEPGSRSIPKANLLGSFSMLSKANPSTAVHSPESSGADEWNLERREYAKDDDNTSVSQSDESEENEENGDPMNEEYDEQLPDYSRGSYGTSSLQMMNDISEDNDDAEGDEVGEEDGEDYEAEDPIDEDDDDIEMGEDDEIRDDDEDDGEGDVNNADEDEGGTSYSSDYSD